jgi:formate dehydrogenase subunit gamma
MSEVVLPGQTRGTGAGDAAVVRARGKEDVVVGDEIVRHRLLSRVIHWAVAIFFFVCLLTGLPIWTPLFGWMATFFGGLNVCRWLHPWSGIVFSVFTLAMFVHWFSEMRFVGKDSEFLTPSGMLRYFRYQGEDSEVGKYNGGQKLLFWLASLATLLLLLSGIVMWFPESFGQGLREASYVVHDVAFIGFFAMIIGHIYLGTAAEPGTFGAMTRGTVTPQWARLHHPKWYREVTGGGGRSTR